NPKEPVVHQLLAVLSREMSEFFPEISPQQDLVTNVIKEAETDFLRTLEQGLHLLDEEIKKSTAKNIPGDKAFDLYDTVGFPVYLTALILRENGFNLDEDGFEKAMQVQKNRSRAASEVATDDWQILIDGNTETFEGYDQ